MRMQLLRGMDERALLTSLASPSLVHLSPLTTCSADRLLLEKRLHLRDGRWRSDLLTSISVDAVDVSVELWLGASQAPEFLQFVGKVHLNRSEWTESTATQWLLIPNYTNSAKIETLAVVESPTEVLSSEAYLRLNLNPTPQQPQQLPPPAPPTETHCRDDSGFRFVLPYRAIRRTRRLRALRVGEIVHERRTDLLHNLLPTTLYGRVATPRLHSSPTRAQIESHTGVSKALVLLQLSCQYASHCVNQLEQHKDALTRRQATLSTRATRLQHNRRLLTERKANLKRESQVLSCSLDGLRMLLRELDPDTFTHLQEELSFISDSNA